MRNEEFFDFGEEICLYIERKDLYAFDREGSRTEVGALPKEEAGA